MDRRIKKMAKQTEFKVSAGYEEKMNMLIALLNRKMAEEKKTGSFLRRKTGFVVCVVCVAVLAAIPVSARVSSLVTERMEKMDKKEKEIYENMLKTENLTGEHDTEALTFSRELSEEEQHRMEQLAIEYDDGMFPEKEAEIVDRLEENTEITSLIYEIYNREFHLPKRKLTDEELLQIIDLSAKSKYTTINSDTAQKTFDEQQEFIDNPYPGEEDISEEEAAAKAAHYLEGYLGKDVSFMSKSVSYIMGVPLKDKGYGNYSISFSGDDNWSYDVWIHGKTGILTRIGVAKGKEVLCSMNGIPVAADDMLLKSIYNEAEEKAAAMLGEEETIVKAACEYNKCGNGMVEDGFVQYYFELDNGYTYQLRYLIEKDIFAGVEFIDEAYVSHNISRQTGGHMDGYVIVPME